ncbi:MAG: polyphosphate polymerase domain-containing protein [Caldilineaceae bacterium]|nr:polyphosphate polymerase domain-containing protein [Caldilineaceae bacterium]
MYEQFADLLRQAAPIGLQELNENRLQDRTDTKYLLHERQLLQALRNAVSEYRVLTVRAVQLQDYSTLYFDTPDFLHYLQHHNGKRSRYKVRCRRYESSALSFLEIKHKNSKNRMIKSRMEIKKISASIAPAWLDFLRSNYVGPVHALEPKVWVCFKRVTLVSRTSIERLTLDLGLQFLWQERIVELPGVAIAEVKRSQWSSQSAFVQQLHDLHIQPTSISKYCLSIMRFYPWLKQNRFKEIALQIQRILDQT